MDLSGLGRFWRIYRDDYVGRRSEREAREQERPKTTARAGFWATLLLAYVLNLVEAITDPSGPTWKALRYAVGIAWLAFAAWYLFEVLARRKARRASAG